MKEFIKKYANLIATLICMCIIICLIGYCIIESKNTNIQIKAQTDVNGVNTDNTEQTTETTNFTNMVGKIKNRVNTNYTVQLDFSADKCISSIENLNTSEKVENKNEGNHLLMSTELTGVKDLAYKYKVTMASGAVETKEFKINDFVPKDNVAPSKPTMTVWPEETSIKKNRDVKIMATSEDTNNDSIEYVWEGRTAETSTYDIGSHTVRVKAVDLYGAESEWTEYTFNVINVEAATLAATINTNSSANFNIKGNGKQTTCGDPGYATVLKVDNNQVNIVNGSGSLDTITLNTTLNFVEDGNYVKVIYTVKNNGTSDKTVSIATHADIMINNDDRATITRLANDRGFSMTDGTYNYKVYLKKTTGVTDVDTYWFGQYTQRTNNLWSNTSINSLVGIDSGMVYSWVNRTIPAGATQEFSVIIGLE